MRTGPLRKDTLEEMLLLALIVSEEMYSSLGYIDYDDCRGKSSVGHDMCMGHDPNATICGMGHDPNGKLQYVRALRIKLAAYKYSEWRCVKATIL